MQKQDASNPSPHLLSPRRRLILALVVGGLATAVVVLALVRQGAREATAISSTPTSQEQALATTTTLGETEIVGRLREILSVRDRAYRERNANLLKSVYSTDCPCLKGDQGAIDQLLKDRAVWVGASTSIRIRNVEKVNDRLWIVVAFFNGSPFRIETESGQLIRAVEGRSELFRFVLGKPTRDAKLHLGFAAPVNEAD